MAKIGVSNPGLTSETHRKLACYFIFLASFTDQSRTDSEPVAWESFQSENELLNVFQPSSAGLTQVSHSTPHPDSHEQIGIHVPPIPAARRAHLPTMPRPFRPSPIVVRRPARQISPGDA